MKAAIDSQTADRLANVAAPYDPDWWMRRPGTLPLIHQPGEK